MKNLVLLVILAACFAGYSANAAMNDAVDWRTDYELVSAGASDQALGPVGGAGDILERLIIVPETTGAGTVSIKDGTGSAMNVFVAGTLSDLHPIVLPLGMRSKIGAWKVTTGSNVHVISIGRFK